MIKFIVWDFDGVICDSKKIAFDVHNDIRKDYDGLPKIQDEYDYANIMNKGYDDSLSKYLDKKKIDSYFLEHRKRMIEKKLDFKVFSKVLNYIKNNHIPSAIITATYEKLVKEVLENNGYSKDIFKYILGRETKGSKADKLYKLFNNLNINKDEIIYIGDTLSDIDFCNKLEIQIICVGYGYCPAELLENHKVKKICNSQKELIEYIDKEIIKKKENK